MKLAPGYGRRTDLCNSRITKWLDAHPRFRIFIPTYSSWLNQVAWWFGLLTDQKPAGAHRSIQAIEKDIADNLRVARLATLGSP
ncbi:hypothetical protein JF770_20905 [Mycobacterium intracellulare]|uniref:hypothetical protein n=1 Tax=Mycobacterium intracellulare TaxID=1767 RepID=UPI001CD9D487|nr:hypothetical protein [Mycobacterium intracellulare]MCA2306032.1 hypothetical protein [Mycobacterium intracellulare]MCA2348259.1 hypothetical protein [Mycobacterium intracellulare]